MSGDDIIVSMEFMKNGFRAKGKAGEIARGKYKLRHSKRKAYIVGSIFWLTIISIILLIIF